MIASACSNLRPSRAFSRLACASSAAKGFRAIGFGPRLAGVSAPRAPLSRCRRQSVRLDEYKPSRRRIAPIPPTSVAPSISARTRSFVCAVKVRRRGRSDISAAARRGRGWHYGRPPASLRTGPGRIVRIHPFVMHDHDGCPSPSRLNFKDSDVSPSLARRVPPATAQTFNRTVHTFRVLTWRFTSLSTTCAKFPRVIAC